MKISLIYARARNGAIGKDGVLPWHLPEDLAHFKQLTSGCPVVMGRRTWDSLPPRFRPLPGRRNIVITRNPEWNAAGAERVDSLRAALDLASRSPDVWVIGGSEVFAQALPIAQVVEVTEIHHDYEGDVFAPSLGADWIETRREDNRSATGIDYSFVTYTKR